MVLDMLESIESEDPQALQLLMGSRRSVRTIRTRARRSGTPRRSNALELQEVMEQQQVVFVRPGARCWSSATSRLPR